MRLSTLIPLLAVPVSLIGTFLVFPLLGFSINTLSLFGLVLAIGIVVDDAIIVVEAVEHHIEHGMSPKDAAYKAMEEVSGPVVAIALILSAVFIAACSWRKRSLQLFRDIVILMRDTGMRNERELYRMRIENLDWETRVIFVPDSKTEEGRRRVPMSSRVCDLLKQRCEGRREGWFSHRSVPRLLTSPQWRRDFVKPGSKLGFPKILSSIVGGMTTAPGF